MNNDHYTGSRLGLEPKGNEISAGAVCRFCGYVVVFCAVPKGGEVELCVVVPAGVCARSLVLFMIRKITLAPFDKGQGYRKHEQKKMG